MLTNIYEKIIEHQKIFRCVNHLQTKKSPRKSSRGEPVGWSGLWKVIFITKVLYPNIPQIFISVIFLTHFSADL